jgi:hypothetical protein
MYKYECPLWYWNYVGVKNLYTDVTVDEKKAREIALKKESYRTGSERCNIIMLQQFECSIKSVKNFNGMAAIPASVEINNK